MRAEDQLILDNLNTITDGFDPHTEAEFSPDSVFSDALVIATVFRTIEAVDDADRSRRMSAGGPGEDHSQPASGTHNVWEAIRKKFGVVVQGGPARFGLPGWVQVIAPEVECPVCGTPFKALRCPYETTRGRQQRYWALVCTTCPRIMPPGDLPPRERDKIYP